MCVRSVRDMTALVLERMLNAVGQDIEAHECNKDCEAEACEHVDSFKSSLMSGLVRLIVPNDLPEWMPQTRPLPDLEVAHDVHNHTYGRTAGIEEQ